MASDESASDDPVRRLSICVLTLDEEVNVRGLKASFDAIADEVEAEQLSLELVIVDAGSADATVSVARELGFDHVLELPGSTIPEARNAAAALTDSPWIGYIDADCRVTSGWITAAVKALEVDDYIVAGWPTIGPETPTWVQRAWQAHWDSKLDGLVVDDEGFVDSVEMHRLVTTRNLVCSRAAFDRLGGFDERLPTGEDSEFAFRASVGDMALIGVPAMRVEHLGEPADLPEFYQQQLWHANSDAYGPRGADDGGVRNGRNAELFTYGFLSSAALGLAGAAVGASRRSPITAVASALPAAVVSGLPALRTAWQRRDASLVAPLSVLYAAYGAARSVDVLGGANRVQSWRTRRSARPSAG